MLTEQSNPRTENVDCLSTLEMLEVINAEDQKVAVAVQGALPQIAEAIDAIVGKLTAGGRLFYVGAGTSGRLGMLDAAECVPTFGTPPTLVQALIAGGDAAMARSIEGAEDNKTLAQEDLRSRSFSDDDVLVGIAASGRTPYVIGGLEYANSVGAVSIALSCNVPAPILELANIGIGVTVGPEVIAGSTRLKAGTAQKLVLNMLSTGTMIQMGKVYGNLMVDVQITNAKLARRARQIVMQITGCDELVADQLLADAGNNVKTAIVMYERAVGQDEARLLLEEADGFLRAVLEG